MGDKEFHSFLKWELKVKSYLILSMCIMFLIQYFASSQWLGFLVLILAGLAFIVCVGEASRFPRIIGLLMLGTGIFLEFYKGAGISGISIGINQVLPIVCLVTLAPLLSVPLKSGGYFKAIDGLLHHLTNYPGRLFMGITTTLFILCPVLSLGSVRIIHDFLNKMKLPIELTVKSYVTGFSTAVFWSPYFASVSLVLYYLKIPVSDYILYGLGLSILSLAAGNLLFFFWKRRHLINWQVDESSILFDAGNRRQLRKLSFLIVLLMLFSLALEHVTQFSMVIIVSLISILLPLIWGIASRKRDLLLQHLKDYRDRSIPAMNNEIMLFISAGLLGHAIQGTAFANMLNTFLIQMASQSFLLFLISVLVIVLALTYIGIHQIAVIAALAMQLKAEELGISNISLAMLLLLSWSISTSLSPFSGLNIMVSRFIGKTGVETGLRANGVHLATIAVIGMGVISILR
jgi:hypothetical protein